MGSNALTLSEIDLPDDDDDDDEDEEEEEEEDQMVSAESGGRRRRRRDRRLVRICSGGDDQALSVALVLLERRSERGAERGAFEAVRCHVETVVGASGSGIKGVAHHPRRPRHLFSVGYDQRLTHWEVLGVRDFQLPDDFFSAAAADRAAAAATARRAITSHHGSRVQQDSSGLRWRSSRLVDVSDVEGLAVDDSDADAGAGETQQPVRLAVFGQGLQVAHWSV
jgi:hypothetical protein